MKEILKGITNHHLDGETKESIRKMSICKGCDESYNDVVFGLRCAKCGCILKYKTKSDSDCPLGKWN
jgi:rRNA maturation endonuclease Nob1